MAPNKVPTPHKVVLSDKLLEEDIVRAVVQRVSRASVRVAGQTVRAIERGFLVLLGVTHADGRAEADWLARKIAGLRVFEDGEGKMNLGLAEVCGAVLVVSQFTLYGDARRGRRPSSVSYTHLRAHETRHDLV